MYFSLDSVPDVQLTLDGAWMDDSDKENSPKPAQLKHFGPMEGESVLPTGPPDSISSLTTRAQRRHAWSKTNGCHGSFVAPAMPHPWPPVTIIQCFCSQLLIRPQCTLHML